MGIIVPDNKEVKHYKGLHLFHSNMSNCSQRVRIALEEKGLKWIGHHLDLVNNEHATPWYQSINPNGVVPTLIHDGIVVIESIDIIQYIDEHFPGATFTPTAIQDQALMQRWLQLAGDSQFSIKVLSHEFLFKPFLARKRVKQLSSFVQNHHNPKLIEFHQEYASKAGLTENKIISAISHMHKLCEQLDKHLVHSTWLAGERFTLADIAWMANVHRLSLMLFPLKKYFYLNRWYFQVKQRPSFKSALEAYEPTLIKWIFIGYSLLQRFLGEGINQHKLRITEKL